MFSQLESLIVFANSESMADAAGRLRISQSALSKRLRSLEHQLGYALIEHQGRRAVLTSAARQLLQNMEPLIAQVSDLLTMSAESTEARLSIALADAIMASWGATLMADLARAFPNIRFDIHSHRTAFIIERLSRGRYHMGICTGDVTQSEGLIASPLANEPMVVIGNRQQASEFDAWKKGERLLDVCCIEQKSSMWAFLVPHFEAWRLNPVMTVESSVGAARLAVVGYAHALVPAGVAEVIARDEQKVILNPDQVTFAVPQALSRPCSLLARKTVLNHPDFKEVYHYIDQKVSALLST